MSQRQVRGPAPKRKSVSRDILIVLLIGVAAVVIAFIYQLNNTEGFKLDVKNAKDGKTTAVSEIHSGDIRINEVMSANDSAYYNESGEASDWVEIINCGSNTVDIEGYTLAKSSSSTNQFIFPSTVLNAGECVVVFCDSKNRATAGYEYHAPFSISRAGDTLYLFNAGGTAVDSINVPEMTNNMAYARDESGAWQVTDEYTPGLANTSENHRTFTEVRVSSPVEISEIVAKNTSYAPDSMGLYHDYIELHNTSNEDVDLSGYCLSDDRNNVMKWRIQDMVIPANGYVIVYCSGLDKCENGQWHTSFKLSTEGETVVLSNSKGQPVDMVEYPLLTADQAYSKGSDGNWTTNIPPTPKMSNNSTSAAKIAEQFAAQNSIGIYINEIAASTTQSDYDWVEIYNATGSDFDLSGWGLSDNASKPRKWRFPQGTYVPAGGYIGVFCSGLTTSTATQLHASFRLSADGGYMMVLADPYGTIQDRVYVGQQFSDLTYGKRTDTGTYAFFTTPTPLSANSGQYYTRKSSPAAYSVQGGVYDNGTVLTVALSCDEGDRIYYTTDCTDPTTSSNLYTGPLQISSTTVLRTRVYGSDSLESYMSCQTYLFGVSHTMRVISLVSDPYNLTSDEAGIMVKGPNATDKYPYGSAGKGANFWMDWEREAHIEIYDTDGTQMVSQECGIKLQGQYSRAENQKAFKVYARGKYSGSSTFDAELFTKRDYTSYHSFLLRSSGQDTDKTRMRDSILTSLAEDTSVLYQETELAVVYLDGQYWGHYNMREHMSPHSICQFEDWVGHEDNVDLVKANSNVMQGSNDTYAALLEWVNKNNTNTDEAYEKIGSVIDIQNFIEYMTIEIFTGNTDTLNVKRYRNAVDGDGKWRWILFDLDWAFYTDTNSIRRWLAKGGMGNGNRTNNDLFIACMKNARFKDEFLTYFGQQMATVLTTKNISEKVAVRKALLDPEMDRQFAKWGSSRETWEKEIKFFLTYAKERPTKLIRDYFPGACGLSDEEMLKYFGDAISVIQQDSGG